MQSPVTTKIPVSNDFLIIKTFIGFGCYMKAESHRATRKRVAQDWPIGVVTAG
jgi:hypothetical protein